MSLILQSVTLKKIEFISLGRVKNMLAGQTFLCGTCIRPKHSYLMNKQEYNELNITISYLALLVTNGD
jgi:hypothetical protein